MKRAALGIDHGTRRTGFAVVDALRIAVTPLQTAEATGAALLKHIERLLDERDIAHFIVGYPLNMDGTPGPRSADVDAFIATLSARFPRVAVVRQDERLTTKEAESRLVEAGHRGLARKARKDAWSAAILLEDWIQAGEPT
ncbi:MAG: Holliday junction resolvase RuvX [Planctomycetota bacterium]